MLDYSKNLVLAIVNAKKDSALIDEITTLVEQYAGSDFNNERVKKNIIIII